MGVQTDISIAFVNHLKTLPGLPSLVAWENGRTVEPVNGQLYYAEYFLPAETNTFLLGFDDPDEYIGVYQISIYTPANSGRPASTFKVDDILTHFKKGTMLSHGGVSFRIEKTGSMVAPKDDGPWNMTVVRIPYRVIV